MRSELERLEDRLVPSSVWNEIYVTVDFGDDTVTGSLPWAYAKATNIYDQDYENQARLIIVDEVDVIFLSQPLIDGQIYLTHLDILHEGNERVVISPTTAEAYRFINHSGNNGIQLRLENLQIQNFGAPVLYYQSIVFDYGDGGAIKTVAPLTLINCHLHDNLAYRDGGAIWADYHLTLEDCDFTLNVAANSGGAIYSAPAFSAPGFIITDSYFFANEAVAGDGGAIYFMTEGGLLGIYGDNTWFQLNSAGGRGGAVYQYGGSIEAISSTNSDPMFSGFQVNEDENGANHLYLEELIAAHIDVWVGPPGPGSTYLIYLVSLVPPVYPSYWSYINFDRVFLYDELVYSNWPV